MTKQEKYKKEEERRKEDERRRAFRSYCLNAPESICERYNYICKDCMSSWMGLEEENKND